MDKMKKQSPIHVRVIMCNDTVKHVVAGSGKQARDLMRNLSLLHYEKFRDRYKSFEVYERRYFWHIKDAHLSIFVGAEI